MARGSTKYRINVGNINHFFIIVETLTQNKWSKASTSRACSVDAPECFILGIKSYFLGLNPKGSQRTCPGENTPNQLKMTQCSKPLVLIVESSRSDPIIRRSEHVRRWGLLVIWPPVCQVNNADEEKGRKRRQVRLQPHDHK